VQSNSGQSECEVSKKILIVEDEADIRAALVAWFEDESFETAEAANGIAGLQEFERFHPDIALLDMRMPGMSGVELCRKIRGISRVPLVMFTADDDLLEVKEAIAEGATDYVLKNSGIDELIDRISDHLAVERKYLGVIELEDAIPANVLANSVGVGSPAVTGQAVGVDANGDLNIDSPSADDLWTWSGEYFGFREDAELWTFEGRHVGRFRRNSDIYRPDGLYLGEVMDGRLIIDWHKTARRASSFMPSEGRSGHHKFADREPFDMQIGFKDFPGVDATIR
jgi:CheY-like chemotaxis protein